MYVDLYTGLSLVQIVRLQKKSPPGQKSAIFSRDRNPFPRCCTCELTQRACFEQEGNGQLVYVDLYTGLSLVQIVRLQKKSPPGQKSAIFSRDRNPFPRCCACELTQRQDKSFSYSLGTTTLPPENPTKASVGRLPLHHVGQ